jgi:hypothetical protein
MSHDQPRRLGAVPPVVDGWADQRDAERAAAVVGIEVVEHHLADAPVGAPVRDREVEPVRIAPA